MTPGGPDEAWAPRPAAGQEVLQPVQLAGYSEFRPLARGGSSDVYAAVQTTTGRPVAVKVVHLRDAEALRRFERELEITVRLGRQHPNIVTVLDTGQSTDGLPCLVMELADLGSVDARLRELGPLPVGDVVTLGTVVADALAFAHAQGVLHRDVKPPNILVLPTSYVLSDFGIARTLDADHSASMELFSYRHAAPQVLDGEPPTAADDVYSLGSTLFTLLTGHAPFAAATPEQDTALAYLHRASTTVAPPLDRPDVPQPLAEAVRRCLAHERADRPTAAELHRLLRAVPTEQRGWDQPAAPPPAAPPPAAPPPAAPPPAAPVPVAPAEGLTPEREAVLAAVAASFEPRPTTDGDPPPVEQTVGMRAEPARAPVVPATKGRGRLPWLVAITLLVAGGVAVVVTQLGGGGGRRAGAPVAAPVPTVAARPSAAGSPSPAQVVAPRLISARPVGRQVRLHWTDPSGGVDTFIVVQLTSASYVAYPKVSSGTTMLTVTPHAGSSACFQVVALNGGGQQASNSVCAS